jgi:polyribonucleotide nucleotidyltransferase
LVKIISKSTDIGDKTLKLEVGRFASQANAAVLAQLGETIVLVTVVSGKKREEIDYLPLSVEYIERLYAGGRIKGSRWVKREGRPSDEAILSARLIDRSVRPLFPKGYKNEIQVVVTVLSVDGENDPCLPAICATSAALSISDIPWGGPIGALRVGAVSKNGEATFVANPTAQDLEYSEMNLVVSSTQKAIVMVEAGMKMVPEKTVLKAFEFAQTEIEKIISLIKGLQKEIGRSKQAVKEEQFDSQLVKKIEKEAKEEINRVVPQIATTKESWAAIDALIEALAEKFEEEKKTTIVKIVNSLVKTAVREKVIKENKRIDGRQPDEIRPIEIEVGLLPRTHSSAMFKRGQTQALTVTTLGSPSLEQLIEGMTGEETKRYIHHYFMPPFSVGEVRRMGWPSRREIGHGALAERALEPVIPAEDKFPYTIRVVSEILSSNGSTSMAAVCGSALSLMDAGVPIKAPVAGIAMGMMSNGNKQVILSDIMGIEDFNGDMDFKVAGTKEGITALQMDVKALTLDLKVLKKALEQARKGRLFILEKMLAVLPGFRAHVSKFAPKIKVLKIPVEKIGDVIGPGGRVIKSIIAETGAAVDVEDDGSINISAPDSQSVDQAIEKIRSLTQDIEVGQSFEGEVKRIQPFGAFVEIAPGKDGLVHVSRMATNFVNDPSEVVKIGQKVKVRVIEIDDRGRINLSMLFGADAKKAPSRERQPGGRKRVSRQQGSIRRKPRSGKTPQRRRSY